MGQLIRRHVGRGRRPYGFTLVEIMIALFLMLIGVVGVLAAMPTGVGEANWVVFQDAAINLAHSKFAEFRRDRMDPSQPGWQSYLDLQSIAGADGFRPFLPPNANASNPYYFFDDIVKYSYRVISSQQVDVPQNVGGVPVNVPYAVGNPTITCYIVTIIVRMSGGTRTFQFKQLMTPYQ